jgi:hypothetical protein
MPHPKTRAAASQEASTITSIFSGSLEGRAAALRATFFNLCGEMAHFRESLLSRGKPCAALRAGQRLGSTRLQAHPVQPRCNRHRRLDCTTHQMGDRYQRSPAIFQASGSRVPSCPQSWTRGFRHSDISALLHSLGSRCCSRHGCKRLRRPARSRDTRYIVRDRDAACDT